MSTIKADNIATLAGVSTSMANAVNGSAKAWVNFNGYGASSPFTTANGYIRAAHNVTSVTDNGVGDYTVNIASGTFSDGNYAVVATCESESASSTTRSPQTLSLLYGVTPSAASVRLTLKIGGFSTAAAVQVDGTYCYVAFFR